MAKLNIADIRQEYTKGGLRESELPGAPLSIHLTTGRRMENQSPCSLISSIFLQADNAALRRSCNDNVFKIFDIIQ